MGEKSAVGGVDVKEAVSGKRSKGRHDE